MIETIAVVVLAISSIISAFFSARAAGALLSVRGEAKAARAEASDNILALRKQMRDVLRDAQRTNAHAQRILDKQYRQQKDVDEILYHAKIRDERAKLREDQANG